MFKNKYQNIFSDQFEAIVLINFQIFFATWAVLKMKEYHLDIFQFKREIFSLVTRLDQSHTSENIWWIIISDIMDELKSVTWVSLTLFNITYFLQRFVF